MESITKLSENEIRPVSLLEKQDQCLQNDIRKLLEYKNEFVDVLCPACGASSFCVKFNKYELTYVECCNCQTIYVNPRPTPEILDIYYKTSENYAYWNKYIFPASEENRRKKIFLPRVERILEFCHEYNVGHDCLLEVGAGFGTFCKEMQAKSYFKRIIAVEPTPDLANTCRNKGLEVIEKPIEQVNLSDQKIDIIVSFEVIEHLFCPRDFINSCASILLPGGLLVLTCPNIKGFDIATLQELSTAVDNEHLNYFHPASISLLLECGFEVLQLLTPGKLDAELVRNKVLAGEFDLDNQPFLNTVLIERWEEVGEAFQKFLADNLLSSHMWVVARKTKL